GIRCFHVTGVQTCALPIYAVRRRLQHFQGAGLVEAAAAGGQLDHHRLARQGAGDEHGLAVLAAGHAAAIVAEVEDLELERGTVESGHVAKAWAAGGRALSRNGRTACPECEIDRKSTRLNSSH